MSSLSRPPGYYKERALRRLGELIPRETEAPEEIEEYPVGPSRAQPDEPPSPKSAPHDAAPAAQIVLPPGLEPPGAFGGGTVGGTLGVGMDREQEPKILFSLNQSSSSDEDEEEAQLWTSQLWTSPPDSERRDWHITPNDTVSEQLQELFSGREMKDGDSIVFAPGTYHLDSTVILYDHDAESQILRNITLRGTPGDVLICAEEACGLDHLFFVCRDLDPFYKGPEHPAIHFSGLNFRNDHLTRGRNAIVCAIGDVDVVMDDCRVLRPHDAPTGRRQNMLGKFRQPLYLGIASDRLAQYRGTYDGYDY